MDVEGTAERLITEALARGDLDPVRGVGEPLPRLDNDPGWWIRDLLERESLPDRMAEVMRDVARLTAAAIEADTLEEARRTLARANAATDAWNTDAPDGHQLPHRSEIWLLDRRAGRPAD